MAAPTRYQEVITATNYSLVAEDGTPFPVFLRFDGTDDSMATGSIDFTGTDKMFVAAGVRKLSDATTGMFAELSANLNINNGGFWILAPDTAGANTFSYINKGTIKSGSLTVGNNTSPITSVLSGIGNISGDSAILRLNGTQVAQSTADQGTGNYGDYPLYIGRRGGSSLPFNGRLYSLVVCGKLASAAEISSTEAWVNQKTRAY